MSDFPDPDEEFELMYGDDLELLNEHDDEFENEPPPKSRRSLNFDTPSTSNNTTVSNGPIKSSDIHNNQSSTSTFSQNKTAPQDDSVLEFTELDTSRNIDVSSQNSVIEYENNKKRTAADLFGDIDDMLFEDETLNNAKKLKLSEAAKREKDLALIEEIVELRKLYQQKQNSVVLKGNRNNTNSYENRDKYNISLCVPKYPFIGVKRHDGEKVYVRFHSEDYEKEDTARLIHDLNCKGIMGDNFKEVWNKATVLVNKHLDEKIPESNDPPSAQDEETELWVKKYKPKKYLELLSDDSTNRIMLKWMKLWDKIVFNRRIKVNKKNNQNLNENKSNYFNRFELSTKLDEYDRPERKVALLSGPPGLGKTTLAHMVAEQAGYEVKEINASDDRSTEDFKRILENANEISSVMEKQNRPKCVVFDEIDGAPQTSIDFLLKFINRTSKSTGKGAKKTEKTSILKRPIICICNDPYVPALRSLRQLAFIVNFPQTSNARLAERLMEIARKEQLKTTTGAMLALAEKSNSDIRSCLAVLQFYKGQKNQITLGDVIRANIGQKDMQKGLFSVWNDIFQIPRQNNIILSNKSRMDSILHTIHSFGDYERLTQGVFENYQKTIKKDTNFSAISEALEWFSVNDMISNTIYTLQNYSLSGYLPYAFVVWHFVFANLQKPKLNYPNAAYEVKQRQLRNKGTVSEVLRGMSPTLRCYCQPLTLLLDTIPFLTRIITPPFRPVNLHLYTKEEKDVLLKVVNVMIDYNLSFVQARTVEGTYVYNLEPNIEDLVSYKSDDFKRRTLSYSNKQLIAKELETEKMRRENKSRANTEVKVIEQKNSAEKKKEAALLPNHMQKLQAKSVKAKTGPSIKKDFFGRVINVPQASSGKSASMHKNDIWYQYKEGYNNAVRKRITISSLK